MARVPSGDQRTARLSDLAGHGVREEPTAIARADRVRIRQFDAPVLARRARMDARPVLLIDGDAEWCARVCRFLEPHGIRVVTAPTDEHASRCLERIGTPSAVVMDMARRPQASHADANGPVAPSLRHAAALHGVPVGYVNKTAALDALLVMLTSNPTSHHRAA